MSSKWVEIRDSALEALRLEEVGKGLKNRFVGWVGEEGVEFVQGFVDEMDDTDSVATHFVAFDNEKAVATSRIFKKDGKFFLGRFAVIKEYRSRGVGKLLLSEVEDTVIKIGGDMLYLHSQLRAQGFYEKCGYIWI